MFLFKTIYKKNVNKKATLDFARLKDLSQIRGGYDCITTLAFK